MGAVLQGFHVRTSGARLDCMRVRSSSPRSRSVMALLPAAAAADYPHVVEPGETLTRSLRPTVSASTRIATANGISIRGPADRSARFSRSRRRSADTSAAHARAPQRHRRRPARPSRRATRTHRPRRHRGGADSYAPASSRTRTHSRIRLGRRDRLHRRRRRRPCFACRGDRLAGERLEQRRGLRRRRRRRDADRAGHMELDRPLPDAVAIRSDRLRRPRTSAAACCCCISCWQSHGRQRTRWQSPATTRGSRRSRTTGCTPTRSSTSPTCWRWQRFGG